MKVSLGPRFAAKKQEVKKPQSKPDQKVREDQKVVGPKVTIEKVGKFTFERRPPGVDNGH